MSKTNNIFQVTKEKDFDEILTDRIDDFIVVMFSFGVDDDNKIIKKLCHKLKCEFFSVS